MTVILYAQARDYYEGKEFKFSVITNLAHSQRGEKGRKEKVTREIGVAKLK